MNSIDIKKKIKFKKWIFFQFSVLFLLIIVLNQYLDESLSKPLDIFIDPSNNSKDKNYKISHSANYDLSEPIIIGNNDNFSTIALEKGWSGSGIQTNPYIITNLNFSDATGDYAVQIKNTDVYFEISNCIIDNYKYSLYFHNVLNFNVTFNIITNCVNGIITYKCKNTYLYNNTLINTDHVAMNIIETENSILNGNYIKNVDYMGIRYSHNRGENRIIYNNTIQNCSRGIGIETTPYSNISHNIIMNCYEGLKLEGSYNNVSWNIFYEGRWCIYNIADFGTITYNNFINYRNTVDDPRGTNIYHYNFWADFQSNDNNSDGIYDEPYIINSQLPVIDDLPVVNIYYNSRILLSSRPNIKLNITSMHYNSQMEVSFRFMSGLVDINWYTPQNTFNLSYSNYELYYSEYQQENWIFLNQDSKISNFIFNSSILDNGKYYTFKIIAYYGEKFSIDSESDLYLAHNKLDISNITRVYSGANIFEDEYTIVINLPVSEYDHSFTYNIYFSFDNGETWIKGKTKFENKEKNKIIGKIEENYFNIYFSTNTIIKIEIECNEGAKGVVYSSPFTALFIPILLKILIIGAPTILSFPILVKIYKYSYLIKKERDIENSDEYVLNIADEVKIKEHIKKIILFSIMYVLFIYNFAYLVFNTMIEDIINQKFEGWAGFMFFGIFLLFGIIYLRKRFSAIRNGPLDPNNDSIDNTIN